MKQERILIIDGNLSARKMFYKFKRLSSSITPENIVNLHFLERLISKKTVETEKNKEIINDETGEIIKISQSGRINAKLKKMIEESDLGPFPIETGVAYGMLRSLISLNKKYPIGKTIICYDPIKKYRKGAYRVNIKGSYKIDRVPDPKDLKKIEENARFFRQLFLAQNIIRLLGIEQTWVKTFEADDLLHYYSKVKFKREKCLILTNDHDINQCIDNTNSILKIGNSSETIFTKKDFKKEFGILPQRYRDVLSLCGCSGDSVGGLPGIGKETAVALIRNFGDLKSVLKNFEEKKHTPKVVKALTEDKKNKWKVVKETRKLISLYGKSPKLKKEIIKDKLKTPKFKSVVYTLSTLKFVSFLGEKELAIMKEIIKKQRNEKES